MTARSLAVLFMCSIAEVAVAAPTTPAAIDAAHAEAETRLTEAQKALDDKVAEIDSREGVDETTKSILKRSAREAEQRRLDREEQKIERDKARELDRIEGAHMRAVDQVRDRIRLASLALPPIPALFLGFWIFMRKRRRERAIIPTHRKRGKQ